MVDIVAQVIPSCDASNANKMRGVAKAYADMSSNSAETQLISSARQPFIHSNKTSVKYCPSLCFRARCPSMFSSSCASHASSCENAGDVQPLCQLCAQLVRCPTGIGQPVGFQIASTSLAPRDGRIFRLVLDSSRAKN